MRPLLALLALLLVPCVSCDPGFTDPSFVDRPRIVGIVTTVDGDPGRAEPLGSERVSMAPIVIAPEGEDGTLSTGWIACLAAPSRSGAPSCLADGMLGDSGPPAPGVIAPISFTLPPIPPSPFGAPSILLVLVSCDGGAVPDLEALAAGASGAPACTGGDDTARGELTIFSTTIATSLEDANHHPTLDEPISFSLGEAEPVEWAAGAAPTGSCRGLPETASLPRVTVAEAALTLTASFSVTGSDREVYETITAGTGEVTPRREALQFSHYATVGEYERQFTAVQESDPDVVPLEIEWTPPPRAEIPTDGVVVRFWWVVRDLRGGMDVVERALCLVPG